jgi:hypothetical protein
VSFTALKRVDKDRVGYEASWDASACWCPVALLHRHSSSMPAERVSIGALRLVTATPCHIHKRYKGNDQNLWVCSCSAAVVQGQGVHDP